MPRVKRKRRRFSNECHFDIPSFLSLSSKFFLFNLYDHFPFELQSPSPTLLSLLFPFVPLHPLPCINSSSLIYIFSLVFLYLPSPAPTLLSFILHSPPLFSTSPSLLFLLLVIALPIILLLVLLILLLSPRQQLLVARIVAEQIPVPCIELLTWQEIRGQGLENQPREDEKKEDMGNGLEWRTDEDWTRIEKRVKRWN